MSLHAQQSNRCDTMEGRKYCEMLLWTVSGLLKAKDLLKRSDVNNVHSIQCDNLIFGQSLF